MGSRGRKRSENGSEFTPAEKGGLCDYCSGRNTALGITRKGKDIDSGQILLLIHHISFHSFIHVSNDIFVVSIYIRLYFLFYNFSFISIFRHINII